MKKIVDGTHHTPTYVEDGVPFLSVKDIRDGKIYFDDCKYISQEEHEKLCQRYYPEYGDLLIYVYGLEIAGQQYNLISKFEVRSQPSITETQFPARS